MNLLTPSGYKNIEDVNIGDEVIAYDINTGQQILNILLEKDLWTHNMLPENPETYKRDEEGNILLDENGNQIIDTPLKTSEEVFDETYGDWRFYLINGTWKLYVNQSIWANMKVVHVKDLQIGDIIYDDNDQDVIITSIEEVSGDEWWRLTISGDHSYISEGITLHNASRYWSGNATPTSNLWSYNTGGITNWGSASGTADNATIPTSADDVILDGAGVKGNSDSTISANITVLSLTFTSGYTSTVTINTNITLSVVNNFTDNISHNWTVNTGGNLTITSNSTITSNGKIFPARVNFNTGSTTKTIVGDWTILGAFTYFTGGATYVTVNKTTNEIIYCNGIFNNNGWCDGTITLRVTGGTISQAYNNNTIAVNEIILDGNITFSNTNTSYSWWIPNFSYLSGTITNANLVTLILRSGTFNWNINPIKFGTISATNAAPIIFNLLSKLNCTNLSLPGCTSTFSGSFGFECDNFTTTVVNANTCTLTAGNTYLVNNSFSCFNYGNFAAGNLGIRSSSSTDKVILTIKNGSTCNTNAWYTRIDASGGRTINTWNATITDCVNVRRFTDLQGVGGLI